MSGHRLITAIIMLVVFLIGVPLFAQAPDTMWTKTYGGSEDDRGHSVKQTSDGGYIIVGKTYSFGVGNSDVYIVKVNASGTHLWEKTYGGMWADEGNAVQQTSDNGFVIVGSTVSFGNGGYDVYLLRTDENGDTLWTKTFGGEEDDLGYSIYGTSDGGFVIAGQTGSFGAGSNDIYVIKTDGNGNILWTKTYGGTEGDVGNAIQQTSDDGFIIAGRTTSFGDIWADIYLIKTDASGDTIWTMIHGGADSDWSYAVQQTTDGGYVIGGWTLSFDYGAGDMYLIKTDADGHILWTNNFGGVEADVGYGMCQTSDNGYIMVGTTKSFGHGFYDVFVLKTDENGDGVWGEAYGGDEWDQGDDIQQTSDDGFILTGYTESFGHGGEDVYLIKLGPMVEVEGETEQCLPNEYKLLQNHPNPFNPVTEISFSLPEAAYVTFTVYNVLGQVVNVLVNYEMEAGYHIVHWNGENETSGMYFYRIEAGDFVETKRMLLLK